MRLDKVDLNLFVVFDAIYRERNVTRVAMQLHLTQPAVSNALSRLRQTFDDPLFIRTPQGMAPTPVADTVVADVREALTLLGRSVGVNAQFNPASSEKVFRLGMNDLAESLLLPRLYARVKQQAPKVSITSYYVEREAATEELKSGVIDLLLDSPVINAKELGQEHLTNFSYVVATGADHPLAGRAITEEEYLANHHIHVSSRRKGRGQVDIALHALGHRRNVVMRVQNYLVAARIMSETDLLWTAPKVLVDTLKLNSAEPPFSVEPLVWNLYWHKSATDDPANLWMREQIKSLVATLR